MINTKKVLTILIINLMVIAAVFLLAPPFITYLYHKEAFHVFFNNFSGTSFGHKFIIKFFTSGKTDIVQLLSAYSLHEVIEKGCSLLARSAALLTSLVSLWLFTIYFVKQEKIEARKILIGTLFLIILNGSAIRLLLAHGCFGNIDMESWDIVSGIYLRGGNVYAETNRYNYPPIWFHLLGFLKNIELRFPILTYNFIIKAFLSGVDLVTLFFLLLITKQEKISFIKTSLFFYLNPVSFLLTGYHGQFDNLAMLMVVIGIYAYQRVMHRPVLRKIILCFFSLTGMLVKHIIFFEHLICLNFCFKRFWSKILLFIISIGVFFLLFIPYWGQGAKGIVDNVFRYGSWSGLYGITSLFGFPWLKYLFVVGLFIFSFGQRDHDLCSRCLSGILFFLTFTTGFGPQYLMLPISLGALRPSLGFLLYSFACALFLLGYAGNVHMPFFHYFHHNIAWIASIYWFVSTQNKISLRLQKI